MESRQLRTTEWEQRIGRAVRELRQRAELTQAELAERSNVSLSAVRYLEAGKGSSLSTLVRVVRALDRTSWLEDLAPPEPSVSPIALLRERRATSRRGATPARAPWPAAPRAAVTFAPAEVIEVAAWGRLVGAVALDPQTGLYAFEYDDGWLERRRRAVAAAPATAARRLRVP